jgi:hypothetical protein
MESCSRALDLAQLLPLMKDPVVFESYEASMDTCAQDTGAPPWRYDPSKPPFCYAKPEALGRWIIRGTCHHIGAFARDLAKAWDGSNWQVVGGNRHTTVVDFATGRIFDVLLSKTHTAKQLIDFVCLNGPFRPLDWREQIRSNEGLESAQEPASEISAAPGCGMI